MDPLTHVLATFALKRGFFPNVPRPVLLCMLASGTAADLDWLTSLFGASAFFRWSGGALHSLLGAVLIAAVLLLAMRAWAKQSGAVVNGMACWLAPLCAALLHVTMDALQSAGVLLFWPLQSRRFALDWLPNFDVWILILLAAGILLPELFRLVSDEIGAKSRSPRGQTGALAALVVLFAYVGLRGTLHTNAVTMLKVRTYRGESARRAGAFPDSTSPFLWHGVVETESAMHFLSVPVGPNSRFDPESSVDLHKPEPTPMLEAAQKTGAARCFLAYARFPKATVQKEVDGYSVELRDLKYDALGQSSRVVQAGINLDSAGRVTLDKLEWQNEPRK